ncbi:hypothetical protein K0J45_16480 [Shewanella alkalitolerans]|uniref:hypothetical protein n=1 Tax=Shewanella alkalitolerans TaxID=2864209 RepID=UPI001C65A7D1|nr:hypothetical protein [Shewanella alkalitolerans]QYJ97088.1 hypothetical protein K0J45_16480 [Shewanella alkalitolerans]
MSLELLKILIQILLSIGAAFLGAWLASRRFRNERWWEKKSEAYSELVEALHSMRWPSSEHFDAGIEHRELSEEYNQELWEEFKRARKIVWKITDSSSFLISSEVLKVVQEMERGLSNSRNANTWFEHLDEQGAAIDTCIEKVKNIGVKELGIKRA